MRRRVKVSSVSVSFGSGAAVLGSRIRQLVLANDKITVTDVYFRTAKIDAGLWYRIIIPKVGSDKRLPVLYLLHGANSGPEEIVKRSDVVGLSTASYLVTVIADTGFSYHTNAKHKYHAHWEDTITEELTRDVEARFAVLRGREHTGVAGIPKGGYYTP